MGLFGKEVFILAQIIVVEDDVYMREELIDVLEKAGYDAVPLLDFENAVSQIIFCAQTNFNDLPAIFCCKLLCISLHMRIISTRIK